MSSVFGKNIKVSVFGQSHAPAVGVVVDGLPAGFTPDMEKLRALMKRRRPGQNIISTQRKEADLFEIISGMTAGKLCGAPLCMIIKNSDTRSSDYQELMDKPRPGHSDYPASVKFGGNQDAAGGGHFSGRLTAPLCLAGGIVLQILEEAGIRIGAHVRSIKDIEDQPFDPLDPEFDELCDDYIRVLDRDAGKRMEELIDQARLAMDSVGGIVECAVTGLPVGVGGPMFEGVENVIAAAIFGIPAVRGIEFGAGFAATKMKGSQHNDTYTYEEGRVVTVSNRHGGVLGGLTTGMPILFRVAIKPTASIFLPQKTVDLTEKKDTILSLKGRHDPCIVPRAVPVAEAVTALAVYDLYLDYLKEKRYGIK